MSIRRILFVLASLFLGLATRASHISGGEIYYDCIGPNQYRFTLVVYRDCAGIGVNNSYSLEITSPCGNRVLTVSTPGGTEVSQLCDAAQPYSTCNQNLPPNSPVMPGMQQYIYTGTITLPPCDSWTISWEWYYRNQAVANLQDPDDTFIYTEAVLNNAVANCNASPEFTNAAIPYVCQGFPVTYSYGAFDADGDSLAYTFIGARDQNGDPVVYTPGFTPGQPISGITLDPVTGVVQFTLNTQGNWVVVVRVDEYRDGVLIGSVMRDMQFIATACTNVPPDPTSGTIINPSGTSTQTGPRAIELCENGSFCFDMVITDPNAGDVLEATSNIAQALPGATFSYTGTNPITCHVCWTGTPGSAGFYPFLVSVNDGACPVPALQSYVYGVTVMGPPAGNVVVTDETCAGMANGTATVQMTGGVTPYTYLWGNGDQDNSITAGAGSYSVTVTDAKGCVNSALTGNIGTTSQPNVAHAGADLIGCYGELPVQLQGNVTNATGGVWTGGAGTFTGAGLNPTYMPTAAEVTAGGVDLYLTTTGNTNCPADKDTVHVTLPSSFFTSSISGTDALCNGATNGSATYLPDTPGFTYLWTDPAGQTAHTASNLGAGTYSVRVEDTYGCDTTLSVTISAPAPIIITSLAVVHEQCAGQQDGSITATVTGGTQPYHYTWSNNAGDVPGITVGAGTYTVSVTDANGCAAATASATVNALGQPNVAQAGADLIGCFSELPVPLQGAVVNATGGIWSGGSGTFTGSGLNVTYMPTTAEITTGGVDLYLTTTGNTTCPSDRDTVHVTLPTSFFASSMTVTDATCFGSANGSAAYLPDTPGFTYLWSDPAGQATATATGLAAGGYTLRVEDGFGCDTTLSVTIGQPDAIAITGMTVLSEQCAGNIDGNITASVTGGTQPYHYTWSNSAGDMPSITVGAGTYTVSVTDANGCAAATASASVTALGQPTAANAGADLIGCYGSLPVPLQGQVTNATGGVWTGGTGTFTGSGLNVTYMPTAAEVTTGGVDLYLTTTGNPTCPSDQDTVHVTLPSSFFPATISATPVACAGDTTGAATFLPADPTFSFLWNDADAQTGHIATGLATGSYSVTVTDAFGCDTTATVFVPEPLPLTITGIDDTHPICAGDATGTATVHATGGTPSYSYSWSANAAGQTTSTASGLASGSYTAFVTDANGCRTQDNVSILSPSVITMDAQVEDTVCVNAPVLLTAQAQGGNGNFTINWSGIGTGDTLTHYFPTSQVVTVSVSDEKGCMGPTFNFPVTVLDISTATLHTYGDTVLCPGSTATVGAWLSGYPSTSTITWTELSSTGNGPFPMVMTQDATFTVTAGDACGNSIQQTIVVDVQTPPAISLPLIIAEGCAPLTAHFPAGLTNQSVTYLWTFGDGTTSNAPAPVHVYEAGIYDVTLTVTTPLGCVGHAANIGQVISHALPVAAFTPDPAHTDMTAPQVHFGDQSTGDISTWVWTFGDGGSSGTSSPSHTYDAPGIYPVHLTVSDAFGCSGSVMHNVQVDPDYEITVPNVFTPDPNGGGGGTYNPIDLSNDVFYPFIRFAKDFRMRIFNRWGELVFESNDLDQGWDGYYRGQISPQDVYVYQVWVRFVDNQEREKLGDLTLFR